MMGWIRLEMLSPYIWFVDVIYQDTPIFRLYRDAAGYTFDYPAPDPMYRVFARERIMLPQGGRYTEGDAAEFVGLIDDINTVGTVRLDVRRTYQPGKYMDHLHWLRDQRSAAATPHTIKRIVPGERYYCRMFDILVISRTEKSITYKNWDGKKRRSKLHRDECGVEWVMPDSYSLAPIYRADRIGKGKKD